MAGQAERDTVTLKYMMRLPASLQHLQGGGARTVDTSMSTKTASKLSKPDADSATGLRMQGMPLNSDKTPLLFRKSSMSLELVGEYIDKNT